MNQVFVWQPLRNTRTASLQIKVAWSSWRLFFRSIKKAQKTINQFFGNFVSTWQTTFFSKAVWVPLRSTLKCPRTKHNSHQFLQICPCLHCVRMLVPFEAIVCCHVFAMFSFPKPNKKTIGLLGKSRVPRTNRQSKRLERAFRQRTCNHEPPAVIWHQHREKSFQYCTTWSSPAQKIFAPPTPTTTTTTTTERMLCFALSKHGSQPTWSLKIDPRRRICKSTSSSLNRTVSIAPLRLGLLIVKNYQGTSPIKLWTHYWRVSCFILAQKNDYIYIYTQYVYVYIHIYTIYIYISIVDCVPFPFWTTPRPLEYNSELHWLRWQALEIWIQSTRKTISMNDFRIVFAASACHLLYTGNQRTRIQNTVSVATSQLQNPNDLHDNCSTGNLLSVNSTSHLEKK